MRLEFVYTSNWNAALTGTDYLVWGVSLICSHQGALIRTQCLSVCQTSLARTNTKAFLWMFFCVQMCVSVCVKYVSNMIPVMSNQEANVLSMNGHRSSCKRLREGTITSNQCFFLFKCHELYSKWRGGFFFFGIENRASGLVTRPTRTSSETCVLRPDTLNLRGSAPLCAWVRVCSVWGNAWAEREAKTTMMFNWHVSSKRLKKEYDIDGRSLSCQCFGKRLLCFLLSR